LSAFGNRAVDSARHLITVMAAVTAIVAGTLAASAASAAAASPPQNVFPPSTVGRGDVVRAQAEVGEELNCNTGTWTGSVSQFTTEWMVEGIPVSSNQTFTVTAADEGSQIWCVITAHGSGGNTEAESSNSVTVPGASHETPPVNEKAPVLSPSKLNVNETAECSEGSWSGNPAPKITYEWILDAGESEKVITGATEHTFKVTSEDAGHSLACKVTATNTKGSESKLSNIVRIPAGKLVNTEAPKVRGVEPVTVGEELTCMTGAWNGSPTTFTYEWIRDRGKPGEEIIEVGANSLYKVKGVDELHTLSCAVIAKNSAGEEREANSSNVVEVHGTPENTKPPTISGTPELNRQLTCKEGTWTGAEKYSFLWVAHRGPKGEEEIAVASTNTYTPTQAESLQCEVTAENRFEEKTTVSSETVVVQSHSGGTKPVNEAPPTVKVEGSSVELGSKLTCEEGRWSGNPAPTLEVQWLRDGKPISGKTATTYVVVGADQGHALACMVTGRNDEGVVEVVSKSVEVPGIPPQPTEEIEVAGTREAGRPLTCVPGKWEGQPPPTLEYKWLLVNTLTHAASTINEATSSTYVVTKQDLGEAIECEVIGHNSAGTVAEFSKAVLIPGSRPENTKSPTVVVSGTLGVNSVLTCSAGEWSAAPAPSFEYEWLLNGAPVGPASSSNTYRVVSTDRGLTISCKVIASNGEGSESATSAGVHVPGVAPEDVQAPTISGEAALGKTLTCEPGIWRGTPPPTLEFEWVRESAGGSTTVRRGASSTYVVQPADVGQALLCVVIATNSEGSSEAESRPVAVSSAGVAKNGTLASTSSAAATSTTTTGVTATITAAQILSELRTQIGRAQRGARISLIRRAGNVYAFYFHAPVAGTLELSWVQVLAKSAHRSKAKPATLASSSLSFPSTMTRKFKLLLTSAGKRLLKQSKSVKLTVKAVFVQAHQAPVTWTETVTLSH
jgi:hypothetical protein